MKHFFALIMIFLAAITFNCRSNQKADYSTQEFDTAIQNKALQIIKSFDTNSIKEFTHWNYAIIDTNQEWTKLSLDSELYYFSYYKYPDVSVLQIFENANFFHDFPCSYYFDNSKFCMITFFNRNDTIYRISSLRRYYDGADSDSLELIKDTLIPLKKIFTGQNPYAKLDSLNSFIDRFKISEIFSRNNIGNFVEFRFDYEYTLTYLPDNLYLNPILGKRWAEKFKKATLIAKNWKLNKNSD